MVKTQIYHVTYDTFISPHPLKSCWLSDRWSLSLLLHLSDIRTMCNFWPQLQILGEGVSCPPPDPAFRAPAVWKCIKTWCVDLSAGGWGKYRWYCFSTSKICWPKKSRLASPRSTTIFPSMRRTAQNASILHCWSKVADEKRQHRVDYSDVTNASNCFSWPKIS